MPHCWTTPIPSPFGPLHAVADADGALTSLGSWGAAREGATTDAGPFGALTEQLARYFAREPVTFDVPLAPMGTPFQARVWAALRDIPFGRTISYAELARRVGSNPRAVGGANGANPIAIVVPCHRVIGSD